MQQQRDHHRSTPLEGGSPVVRGREQDRIERVIVGPIPDRHHCRADTGAAAAARRSRTRQQPPPVQADSSGHCARLMVMRCGRLMAGEEQGPGAVDVQRLGLGAEVPGQVLEQPRSINWDMPPHGGNFSFRRNTAVRTGIMMAGPHPRKWPGSARCPARLPSTQVVLDRGPGLGVDAPAVEERAQGRRADPDPRCGAFPGGAASVGVKVLLETLT